MSKLITTLLAGALCSTSYVALAVDAQPMDESTNPNRGTDMPTENMQQKPDRSGASNTSGSRSSRSDREYMDRWSESSGGSGSAGGTGTNNPNSNSDVSGGDQIERGADKDPNKVEKLRQKPNPERQ
ncbi:MAG TPA: hypothetical protein VEA39_06005 [Methylophilaceae bacterium]|nr:hypothetical protein [Methylophilaceae bacterium]